jgi:hypothetical protein
MRTFEIKNRWDLSHVLWSGEAKSLGEAVRRAIADSADLTDADLTGAKLSGADLRRADLTGAKLSDADLTGAKLSDADLRRADLTGAKLSDADLTGAKLSGADLRRADLTGADLTGAVLTGAVLTGAKLTDAVGFRFADAPDPRELRLKVADHIENHPDLHNQADWGDGSDNPACGTPCCVAGWACHLGGGARDMDVSSAAVRLLWVDGAPMPSFSGHADRESILTALRASA